VSFYSLRLKLSRNNFHYFEIIFQHLIIIVKTYDYIITIQQNKYDLLIQQKAASAFSRALATTASPSIPPAMALSLGMAIDMDHRCIPARCHSHRLPQGPGDRQNIEYLLLVAQRSQMLRGSIHFFQRRISCHNFTTHLSYFSGATLSQHFISTRAMVPAWFIIFFCCSAQLK
jgi:hypothetical protein